MREARKVISNFEPKLKYKGDGNLLEVCGELKWNTSPNAQNVRVAVVVVQDDVVAIGASNDLARGTAEWMFEVKTTSGKFASGPARGFGVLIVTDPHGEAPFSWDTTANGGITLAPA